MSNLKFAKTHNLVEFLDKPKESVGFEKIVDFLNANPIRYALTVNPTLYISRVEQFWATAKVKTVNEEVQLQALVDRKKVIITESTIRRDLHLEDAEGIDCLPNATIFKELTRMSAKTTAWNEFSSIMASAIICLATNQKFNFSKYIFESMLKNLDNPSAPSSPVADEDVLKEREDTIAQTRSENVSQHSSDPLLSGEDRLKIIELMELCTKLQQRVLDLETSKTAQAQEITSLKKRVKKQEKKKRSKTYGLKRLYKVGLSVRVESSEDEGLGNPKDAFKHERKIHDIDADEDITLENVHDAKMFDVSDLHGDEVIVGNANVVEETVDAAKVSTAAPITSEEITLAQALIEIRSTKPKEKGIVLEEPSETTTTTAIFVPKSPQDKGKGIMVEEPVVELVKLKRKEQIRMDEELALKIQAEEEEEEKERLAREKAQQVDEANITWDDVQARVEADYELA
ncbi:hypothetical protein Tco_0636059 [Tanacetum coccineum]